MRRAGKDGRAVRARALVVLTSIASAFLLSACLSTVSNPNFTGGLAPWHVTPGANFAIYPNGYGGQNYLETNQGSAGPSSSAWQDVSSTPQVGATYTATVWMRGNGAPVSVNFVLWALGGTANELGQSPVTVPASTSWTQYTVSLVIADPGHNDLRLQVYNQTGSNLDLTDAAITSQPAPNNNFASGANDWQVTPGANVAIYPGGHDGQNYLESNQGSAGPDSSVWQDMDVVMSGPSTYTATVWMRDFGGSTSVDLVLWGLGSPSGNVAGQTPITLTPTWTQYSVSVALPNSAFNDLRLQIYNQTGGNFDINGATILDQPPPPLNPTTTSLSAAPPALQIGQSADFTATVTPDPSGGTMTFSDGELVLCAGVPVTSGTATCDTAALPAGTDAVTATYSGDADYTGSAVSTAVQVAPLPPTTTTVSAAPTTISFGQSDVLTATVSPTPDGGTVTFSDGGGALCSAAALSSGQATCTTAALPVGSDMVTATYSGDADYAGSSGTTTVVVSPLATTTAASVTPSSAQVGQPVTVTATVSPTPDGGTVTFSDGGGALCSAAALSSGQATCTTAALPVGSDMVTATYSGDADYAGSTGSTTAQILPPVAVSSNWSGYVAGSGPFAAVSGTFSVTSLNSGDPATDAMSEWVGIDGAGAGDTSLIQAGIEEFPDPGDPSQSSVVPWWEILPADPYAVDISTVSVSVGDQVTVTIDQLSGTEWSITLTDDTNGQTFTTDQTYTGPGSSAEWIVEAPTNSSGSIIPLAPYAPVVDFSDLRITPVNSTVQELVMVQAGNQVATPSALAPTGFNVAYGDVAPAAP